MGFDLFKKEEQLLLEGEELLQLVASGEEADCSKVEKLVEGFRALLDNTRKLVSISDRNQDKLNTLAKELASKNALLEEQKSELVKAAELRDDVDRITRHDLKTPLNSIIATPQILLMKADLSDRQKAMVKRIEESGYRMLNMINSSLDIFKMEQGTYKLQPERVDLVDVVRSIFREHSGTAAKRGADLMLEVDGTALPEEQGGQFMVKGEKLLLYSMLANLVKNGLEATPKGMPVKVIMEAGHAVRVMVRNSGAIPESIRDTFFEKYVTGGKQGGTGLGTYSARLIAQVHGGEIAFRIGADDSTTVVVTLPE